MSNRSTKSAGRPVGSTGRDTRDLIISKAVRLFADHGVAATTFATIAKRAGLTPAMMHYYFRDRDQLLDAVVDERLAPVVAKVWNPIQAGENPGDMVRNFVHCLLSEINTKPWISPTWIREVLNEGGLLRSRMLRRIPREKVRTFCDAVAHGQRAGAINPEIDPVLTVFSMLGLVMMHSATLRFFDEIFHQGPTHTETLERHITALLLNGLCREPALKPGRKTKARKAEH
jgi:TetR/AcrR family transcriptional regulator